MNILPTGPHLDFDQDYDRYFADLRRWNFDVAYNAHYAFPLRDVLGRLEEPYRKFARRARLEGVRSCIQIQSTVANSDDVPVTETQRYVDNRFFIYEHFEGEGKKNHFGSFASKVWLEHLKRLTGIFRDYGFDWVVFEEPMVITDIPGPDDPMHALFRERFPEMEYPGHQSESREYLALQRLKRDTLVEFYGELCRHAKSLGFEMVGIMPWFFTPTFENTAPETWVTSCDTGRLTFLPDLDFIIVRMQPDNISGQAMIAATGECRPTLAYYECLAHALGKPIIMVNNPTDEHRPENWGAPSLIPYDFFRRYTLAAAAASPQGMSRHWYGKDYENDSRHMELLAEVNDLFRRLGPAQCEVAFVFSFFGASHVWPRPWREVWRAYWTFAEEMVERERIPFLTIFAESLAECLEHHPEVKVVVLNEFFPIPPTEVSLLEEWLAASPERRIVYFGGRDGYHWEGPLHTEYRMRPPEMARLVGIDVERPVRLLFPDPGTMLVHAGSNGESAVLGPRVEISVPVVARPEFVAGAGVEEIYGAPELENLPVLTRRRSGSGGEAWLVAVSLEGRRFNFPLGRLFRGLLRSAVRIEGTERVVPRVGTATDGMFWNVSATGYLVVANCTARPGELQFDHPVSLWEISGKEPAMKTDRLAVGPLTLRAFRLINDSTRVYDVRRSILLEGVDETAHGTAVRGRFHRDASLLLSEKPERIRVNGQDVPIAEGKASEHGLWVLPLPVEPGIRTEVALFFSREARAVE